MSSLLEGTSPDVWWFLCKWAACELVCFIPNCWDDIVDHFHQAGQAGIRRFDCRKGQAFSGGGTCTGCLIAAFHVDYTQRWTIFELRVQWGDFLVSSLPFSGQHFFRIELGLRVIRFVCKKGVFHSYSSHQFLGSTCWLRATWMITWLLQFEGRKSKRICNPDFSRDKSFIEVPSRELTYYPPKGTFESNDFFPR